VDSSSGVLFWKTCLYPIYFALYQSQIIDLVCHENHVLFFVFSMRFYDKIVWKSVIHILGRHFKIPWNGQWVLVSETPIQLSCLSIDRCRNWIKDKWTWNSSVWFWSNTVYGQCICKWIQHRFIFFNITEKNAFFTFLTAKTLVRVLNFILEQNFKIFV
jgi:hypothetical protein